MSSIHPADDCRAHALLTLPDDVWLVILGMCPFGNGATHRALSLSCRRLQRLSGAAEADVALEGSVAAMVWSVRWRSILPLLAQRVNLRALLGMPTRDGGAEGGRPAGHTTGGISGLNFVQDADLARHVATSSTPLAERGAGRGGMTIQLQPIETFTSGRRIIEESAVATKRPRSAAATMGTTAAALHVDWRRRFIHAFLVLRNACLICCISERHARNVPYSYVPEVEDPEVGDGARPRKTRVSLPFFLPLAALCPACESHWFQPLGRSAPATTDKLMVVPVGRRRVVRRFTPTQIVEASTSLAAVDIGRRVAPVGPGRRTPEVPMASPSPPFLPRGFDPLRVLTTDRCLAPL